jgi:polar amino acid transport system substrate-binding protein
VAIAMLVLAAGCATGPAATGGAPAAKVPDTALVRPGTLTVAIDNAYPPFAGSAGARYVGLDVDVAAALADQLGLKVAFVPYDPAKPGSLAPRSVDIALGAVTPAQATALKGSWAASYATDGPALFATDPATLTVDALTGKRIGAQQGSESYWRLKDVYGSDVQTFTTTRDALGALAESRVDAVGADAVVGAYIARDFPKVRIVGVIAPATSVGVVVFGDRPLQGAVTKYLAVLESSGVLKTLRAKWTGTVEERLAAPSGDTTPRP